MKWRGEKQSSNVEDGRGERMSVSSGSLGALIPIVRFLLGSNIGRVVLAVGVVAYFMGYNPLALLDMGAPAQTQDKAALNSQENRDKLEFVSVVLAQTEDIWSALFKQQGASYVQPKLRLFTGQVKSGCGFASSQVGPFYCPADQKIYLDTSFFDELAGKYKAKGDFAQAYVIAHEVGHHVQNLAGTLERIQAQKARVGKIEQNALQVKVELQADCYAGIWAHYLARAGRVIEAGDIDEALGAASAIGDDTLQKQAQGYVVPDSFTHGSSAQRMQWFKKGFEGGTLKACAF